MPDPTMGTFAQAQLSARAKFLGADDVDLEGVAPGDTVKLGGENGEDVVGTVFLMSGGGKGPGGKNKTKYKSELAVSPCGKS